MSSPRARTAVRGRLAAQLLRVLRPLIIGPSERAARRLLDGRPPETSVRAMERDLERGAARIGDIDVAALFEELMVEIGNDPRAARAPRVPAPRGALATSVCSVFDELDRMTPLGTLALLSGSGLYSRDRLVVATRTQQLRIEARLLRGERRSDALQALALHSIELEYGWFLRIVLQASWAGRNLCFRERQPLGLVFREISEQGTLGRELWRDAQHVRNAAAHGDWRFDLDHRAVVTRDRGLPAQRHAMPGLYRELCRVADAPSVLSFVLERAQKRDMLASMVPAFAEFCRTRDEERVARAVEPLAARIRNAHARLLGLGWARVPP
jgi:hypothetical protein